MRWEGFADSAENAYISISAKNCSLRKIAIAIDGPAASGKSTTARLVAKALRYVHVDTGAMYRALTLKALREGLSPGQEKEITALAERTRVSLASTNDGCRVFLDDEDVSEEIRKPEVTANVSQVSSYQGVREVLVREQRAMAQKGGVVLEGRDIGTVVIPDAELKIFMVAEVQERARRRVKDLENAGISSNQKTVMNDLKVRDQRDSRRAVSPLRKSEDAIELDTTRLTIDQQVEFIVNKAKELIGA